MLSELSGWATDRFRDIRLVDECVRDARLDPRSAAFLIEVVFSFLSNPAITSAICAGISSLGVLVLTDACTAESLSLQLLYILCFSIVVELCIPSLERRMHVSRARVNYS